MVAVVQLTQTRCRDQKSSAFKKNNPVGFGFIGLWVLLGYCGFLDEH